MDLNQAAIPLRVALAADESAQAVNAEWHVVIDDEHFRGLKHSGPDVSNHTAVQLEDEVVFLPLIEVVGRKRARAISPKFVCARNHKP